jgi:hypothetical protein
MASVYPGYHIGFGPGSVITGALYGFVDGAIGGAVSELAWYFACVECGANDRTQLHVVKNSNDLKLPPNTQSRTPRSIGQ